MKIAFVIGIFAASAWGQTPDELYIQGNGLYESGNYEAALVSYMEIIEGGVEGGEIWFNIGNAYYKLGRTGPAVLAYERALKLAPGDEEIIFNLKVTNLLVKDRIAPVETNAMISFLIDTRDSVSADGAIKFVIGIYILGVLTYSLTIFLGGGKLRKTLLISTFVIAGGFLISGIFTAFRVHHEVTHVRAVVMAEELSVTSAPEEIGEELFLLHEGTTVDILGSLEEWRRIRVADGMSGWVPGYLLEKI